jgi:hypothetical protein
MTETAQVLKSGVAPAGRHFCGAQVTETRRDEIARSNARFDIE